MIAKCIKSDNEVDLTINKIYEVKGYDNCFGRVRLVGDNGELYWYAPIYLEVWE